jgi:hypothetical protein
MKSKIDNLEQRISKMDFWDFEPLLDEWTELGQEVRQATHAQLIDPEESNEYIGRLKAMWFKLQSEQVVL